MLNLGVFLDLHRTHWVKKITRDELQAYVTMVLRFPVPVEVCAQILLEEFFKPYILYLTPSFYKLPFRLHGQSSCTTIWRQL